MKVRDSGMPTEDMWASFFNIDLTLSELQINSDINDMVEVGCGYGTFTIAAAKRIKGDLYSFDIEVDMLEIVAQKIRNEFVNNVILEHRDILIQSTGLADTSIDYVMLFNILHNESPSDFIDEAFRILKPNGKIGIIHWRSDIETPRGPDFTIRPTPLQILQWIDRKRFSLLKEPAIIKPYHFGLILSKI